MFWFGGFRNTVYFGLDLRTFRVDPRILRAWLTFNLLAHSVDSNKRSSQQGIVTRSGGKKSTPGPPRGTLRNRKGLKNFLEISGRDLETFFESSPLSLFSCEVWPRKSWGSKPCCFFSSTVTLRVEKTRIYYELGEERKKKADYFGNFTRGFILKVGAKTVNFCALSWTAHARSVSKVLRDDFIWWFYSFGF